MNKRSKEHLKLIEFTGIKSDEQTEALNMMLELEEVQGCIDDSVDLLTRQSDVIETVIQKLIKGNVNLG